MTNLLVKAQATGRVIADVTPASAGWTYVGFKALRLAAGDEEAFDTGARECCITVLAGAVDVQVGAQRFSAIGNRATVFEDRAPAAVYVPPGQSVRLVAAGPAEVALSTAPAEGRFATRVIAPAQMARSQRGQGSNTRYVCDILPQTDAAESLLVVEVVTPAAHSSSYPPHKHDSDNVPQESSLEETYYHRIDPPQGFAFQRVYTDDRALDESMAVCDRDLVMVPRGYHPVVMPHGYRGYYLNVMAGPRRVWHFKNDPAHDWLMKP